jgi:hypothetical protein
MAMLFMMALGTALMLSTMTETRISGHFRNSSEALYAADAGLERAIDDLRTIHDWNSALGGTATSAFVDGSPGGRVLADGSPIDVNDVIARANCQKMSCSPADLTAVTAERPWGPNNPRWQPFAYGPLDGMTTTAGFRSPFYVVVMVADDPSENDGDPLRDGAVSTNPGAGRLMLRSEAFGPGGIHRALELTVARTDFSAPELAHTGPPGENPLGSAVVQPQVRILSWRDVR